MGHWTQADFDNAYSYRVERHFGSHPSRSGRPEMRLHYTEWAFKPMMVNRWRQILRILTPAINASDRVLIVGAGFGWGVRALRNRIGCAAIGTDTSPYIQGQKDNDDSAEVDHAVTVSGLNPTSGRGLFLRNQVRTPGARAKEMVLDEDLRTPGSRNHVAALLGGAPTWAITEDLVDDTMTDAEITTLAGRLDQFAARKTWLYTPSKTRSSEQLAALTGHQIIEFGTYRLVG